MKKKLSILLLLIMLLPNIGLTLDKHYCNGKLVNIFILFHSSDGCDGSMPMDDDSCEDEYIGFTLESPFNRSTVNNDLVPLVHIAELHETLLPIKTKSRVEKTLAIAFTFPPVRKIKIYIQVESFLN